MFKFSTKTNGNFREFKVSDFLSQIDADRAVRVDARCIKKIIFQNVIDAKSMNVDEDENYKIIYVIKITVDEERIPRLFVERLDKAIDFHTYFLIEYESRTATLIAFKQITKQSKRIDKYYGHGFAKDEDIELVNINSIADVYKNILSYEIGIRAGAEEDPAAYYTRVKEMNKIAFQISKVEKAIECEIQPKKKFEYNSRLRELKSEYDKLTEV